MKKAEDRKKQENILEMRRKGGHKKKEAFNRIAAVIQKNGAGKAKPSHTSGRVAAQMRGEPVGYQLSGGDGPSSSHQLRVVLGRQEA